MIRVSILCILISTTSILYAQTPIVHQHIQQLAGTSMYGRGYVNNGIGKAATYIDSCFTSYQLQSYKALQGYRQQVSYDVNTFPGTIQLTINDTILLEPGVDFLVSPHSPSAAFSTSNIVRTTKLRIASGKLINGPINNKVLLVDERGFTSNDERINEVSAFLYSLTFQKQCKAIVEITNSKLSWNVSDKVGTTPYFTINSPRVPNTISSISYGIEQQFIKNYKSYNICGYIPGSTHPDSLIVLTAHYDHLGMMGEKTMFPGANDNASGVAMLLNLAEHFSKNQPKKTIVCIALTGEEIGLKGAIHFVNNSPFSLNHVNFLINFDMAGTGDAGIQIVNSTIFKKQTAMLDSINAKHSLLPEIKKRGEACNSDHCPFYTKGVPSFYIYTLGGIQAYHDVYDRRETLPLTKYNEYFELMQLFISLL